MIPGSDETSFSPACRETAAETDDGTSFSRWHWSALPWGLLLLWWCPVGDDGGHGGEGENGDSIRVTVNPIWPSRPAMPWRCPVYRMPDGWMAVRRQFVMWTYWVWNSDSNTVFVGFWVVWSNVCYVSGQEYIAVGKKKKEKTGNQTSGTWYSW